MRQIIQGLEYIHHLNIVHLDIKPYNILFSDKVRQWKIKIVLIYLRFLRAQTLG